MNGQLILDSLPSLAAIVGTGHAVRTGGIIVVSPANQQEIAELLRFANDRGLVVNPVGAGTKQAWGNPVSPAIRLSLARLDRLRDHAWQDMTCTVEAGCTWSAMQNALAQHGQMVALDPLWPAEATIGGIVATNDSGSLRLKYGSLRDHIIGMTVVLADGTIAKTGGKVVKNVAGYDLHKLMCGSYGTLGIIAEINFRLHPLEQHARSWSIVASDAISLDAPFRALIDSQMELSSLQLRSTDKAFSLDLRIASLPETIATHLPQIEAIANNLPLQTADEAVWQSRQNLFNRRNSILIKASMLPGQIASTTQQLHVWAAETNTVIDTVAQATGLMTIALGSATLLERLRELLRFQGGNAVVLQAQGSLDVWGSQSDTLPLMREIKRLFDPGNILNPGRFVGGI